MDDEILRFNSGMWPDIETKNTVVKPKAMERVLAMNEVLLFCSYMSPDHMQRLRDARRYAEGVRDSGYVDRVISGERETSAIASEILRFARSSSSGPESIRRRFRA